MCKLVKFVGKRVSEWNVPCASEGCTLLKAVGRLWLTRLPEPSKTLCCRCLPRLGHFITQIPMCGVKAVGYLRIIEACHLADLGSMHLAHPELWIRSVCAVAPALKSLECMSNMSGYVWRTIHFPQLPIICMRTYHLLAYLIIQSM